MSLETESSIALDVFTHPSRSTMIGMVCIYLAACGAVSESDSGYEPTPATIVCDGRQDVFVSGSGKTYQGLVEANVQTDPSDGLKSDTNLAAIAHATAKGFDGDLMFAYPVKTTKNIVVSPNTEVTLPISCEPLS